MRSIGIMVTIGRLRPVTLELGDNISADVEWLTQMLTEDLEERIRELAEDPSTPRKEVAKLLGLLSTNDWRNTNPRYVAVKHYFEAIRGSLGHSSFVEEDEDPLETSYNVRGKSYMEPAAKEVHYALALETLLVSKNIPYSKEMPIGDRGKRIDFFLHPGVIIELKMFSSTSYCYQALGQVITYMDLCRSRCDIEPIAFNVFFHGIDIGSCDEEIDIAANRLNIHTLHIKSRPAIAANQTLLQIEKVLKERYADTWQSWS